MSQTAIVDSRGQLLVIIALSFIVGWLFCLAFLMAVTRVPPQPAQQSAVNRNVRQPRR